MVSGASVGNRGGEISALLSLDISKFKTGIEEAENLSKNLSTSLNSVGKTDLSKLQTSINEINTNIKKLVESFAEVSESVNKTKTSFEGFETSAKESFESVKVSAEIAFESIETSAKESVTSITANFSKIVDLGNEFAIVAQKAGVFGTATENITAAFNLMADTVAGKTSKMRAEMDNFTASLNKKQFTGLEDLNSTLDKFKTKINLTSNEFKEFGLKGKEAINEIKTSLNSLNFNKTGNLSSAFSNLNTSKVNQSLMDLNSSVDKFRNNLSKVKVSFNEFSSSGMSAFRSVNSTLQSSLTNVTNGFGRFREELSNVSARYLGEYSNSVSRAATSTNNLGSAHSSTSSQVRNTSSALSSTTTSASSSASAIDKSSNSAKNATTSYKGMGSALSSLTSIGRTMVSLFAYDFVLSLAEGVRGTLQQKSEMEGFIRVMGLTTEETKQFNQALDNTVAKFGKLSRYNLGETVASLGVEFNLTTEEMAKAMDITAMLQSEYIRAGRTADEATLAVKDIMQGEFVRLSRETGVGKGDLMAAGWTGETSDIESLMDALEKVGKSRHWDVFAAKANSLSDVIQITRSRFQDFTADILDSFTPAVLFAFNGLISIIDRLGMGFGTVGSWLAPLMPIFDNMYTKILMIGTAISGAVAAFVMYRTGMGLMDIAQQGLVKSLIAAVLGIEGETAATLTSAQAIAMKITGLSAETVAETGALGAIATRVLGLDSEIVGEYGVLSAIVAKTLGLNAEMVAQEGLIATMMTKTGVTATLISMEELSNLTLAQKIPVLLAAVAGVEAETIAKIADVAATDLLTASWIALTAAMNANPIFLAVTVAILALVAAVAELTKSFGESASVMSDFNNAMQTGDQVLQRKQKTINAYNDELTELKNKRSQLTAGSEEYIANENKIAEVEGKVDRATKDLQASTRALEKARSVQGQVDSTKEELAAQNTEKLAEAYKKAGMSAEEAEEKASSFCLSLDAGTKKLKEYGDGLQYWLGEGSDWSKQLDKIQNADNLTDSQKGKYTENMGSINSRMSDAYERWKLSDDGWESFWGWWDFNTAKLDMGMVDIQSGIDAFFNDMGALFKPVTDFFNDPWNNGIGGAINNVGNWLLSLLGFDGEIDFKGILETAFKPISDFFADPIGKIKEFLGIGDGIGDLFSGEPLITVSDIIQWLFDLKSGYDEFASNFNEWVNSNIVQPVSDWINGFLADPLSYIGAAVEGASNWILKALGLDEESGTNLMTLIPEWFNNNIILPLTEWVGGFLADPLAYIMAGVEGATDWLLKALGLDEEGAANMMTGLSNFFLVTLPQNILGFLKGMWAGLTGGDTDAQNKGAELGKKLGDGLLQAIGNIPILGDILKMLGIIPQANGDASSKGQGLGSSATDGFRGAAKLASVISDEIGRVISNIAGAAGRAFEAAKQIGGQILQGFKSALGIASPGLMYWNTVWEIERVENALQNSNAEQAASDMGQSMIDGFLPQMDAMSQAITENMSNMDSGINASAIAQYQNDAILAQNIAQNAVAVTGNEFMGLGDSVGLAFTDMGNTVATSYQQMDLTQQTALANMKNQNTTGFNQIQTTTTNSLRNMQTTTQTTTQAMTNAWLLMKTNIVNAANQLQSQATVHFNQLSNTIGSFYRKIQNPSQWGAGDNSPTRYTNTTRGRSGLRMMGFAGGKPPKSRSYAGSPSSLSNMPTTMNLSKLLELLGLSKNGYNSALLGMDVDVAEFSRLMGGVLGWGDWHPKHMSYIKDKSGEWDMKGPTIDLVGGIPTGLAFKVKEFYNGKPNISFASFQTMAEAIFSRIPYDYYYNSDKTGDWLSAMQSGSVNCWDGAHALIAFAQSCGFSGSIANGTWNGIPHVYAIINGKKMDTTGWQQRRSWDGVASGPAPRSYGKPQISADSKYTSNNSGVNVNIDLRDATIYGVEKLEEKIEEGVNKGMQNAINPSIATGI